MDALLQSCEHFDQYPQNITQNDVLSHTLESYSHRLNEEEKRLFDAKKAAIDFLDFQSQEQGFLASCVTTLEKLKEMLQEGWRVNRDPQCRFVFLHAPHSRAPLKVSRGMLSYLFTYHQVMPPFLDFIFPFGMRIEAQDFYFVGLRNESRLGARRGLKIPGLERSGHEVRLCYNLRSVERSESQPGLKWSIRQSAMYHSFDLETGRSLWINVKGNRLIKNRITEAVGTPAFISNQTTREMAFAASLSIHMLLFNWACENWSLYLHDLEREYHRQTTSYVPIDLEPSQPPPLPPPTESPWSLMDIVSPNARWGTETTSISRPVTKVPQGAREDGDESPPEVVLFKDIQALQGIGDKLPETILMLRLNVEVLEELRQHYQFVTSHSAFPSSLKSHCEIDMAEFMKNVLNAEKDLRILQSRAEALLRMLENRISLLNDIINYRGVKANRSFAMKNQLFAERMENETVSMRVITTVTLFFLPATFIATFMSTDILKYENGKQYFQSKALRMYLAMALPLTAITFFVWWMFSRMAKKTSSQEMLEG